MLGSLKRFDDAATKFFRDKKGKPVGAWQCWFERVVVAMCAILIVAIQALFLAMITISVFNSFTGNRPASALPDALITCGMYLMGAAIVPVGAAMLWGIIASVRSALVGPRFCLTGGAYLILFAAPIFVLDQVLKAPWWAWIAYLAGFALLAGWIVRKPSRRARIVAALGLD